MSSKPEDLPKSTRGLRIGGRKNGPRRSPPLDSDLFNKIVGGDIATLARAMTIVTSTGTLSSPLKNRLIASCRKGPRSAARIAITGGLGTGKSRLIERLAMHLVTVGDKRPCVLTLDSSTQRTGGCILGNKAFMRELIECESVFVRPLSSGTSGAKCTTMVDDAIHLCAAAPFDTILLEMGDNSPARSSLASLSDCLISVIPAGSDGDLAAMRCFIGHEADIHVITWPTGVRRDKALITMRALSETLALFNDGGSREKPLVISFTEGDDEAAVNLWQTIANFCARQKQSGEWDKRRAAAHRHLLQQRLCARFEEEFFAGETFCKSFDEGLAKLSNSPEAMGEITDKLLGLYCAGKERPTSVKVGQK